MVPCQHERDEKPNDQRQGNAASHAFRPAKLLRDNVNALEERKGRRDISHSPLHQFALLQALEEFVHRAASFSPTLYFANNVLKSGSSRIGSHTGSIRRVATDTVSPPEEDKS